MEDLDRKIEENIKVREIREDGNVRIVLENNGEIIGRCYVYFIKNNLHEKPYAFLEDVFVNEKYRNRGYGSILVKKAIEIAKRENCYKIIATSRFERENVHRFYEKLGFKKWGYEFRIDL